jgi:hypothetical protein
MLLYNGSVRLLYTHSSLRVGWAHIHNSSPPCEEPHSYHWPPILKRHMMWPPSLTYTQYCSSIAPQFTHALCPDRLTLIGRSSIYFFRLERAAMSVVAVPDQIEEKWSAIAVPQRSNLSPLWKLWSDVSLDPYRSKDNVLNK